MRYAFRLAVEVGRVDDIEPLVGDDARLDDVVLTAARLLVVDVMVLVAMLVD